MTRWKSELREFLNNTKCATETNEFRRARIEYRFGRIVNTAAVSFQCLNNASWHRRRYVLNWFYGRMGNDDADRAAGYSLQAAKSAIQDARLSPAAPLP